jgi:diketogulonate reductase-like aldo/keto reductase
VNKRREFLRNLSLGSAALAVPSAWQMVLAAQGKLPTRAIPDSGDSLPIVGFGNSNAFRQDDGELSKKLIGILYERGGSYVDCSGTARFVVAEAARNLGIGKDLFLGTYFSSEDETSMRTNIPRLLELTGKERLDLVQSYPEFALPNWDLFRQWQAEGLTKYIGLARHQSRFYEAMMRQMDTGTVDFVQVNYSPLETEADQKILPMAQDKGVAVTINRPFMNGEYFSRVKGHAVPEWAQEFDCDNWAAFSIKFILSNPAVTCVLTETANPDHAAQNIEAGMGRLPDEKTRQRMVAYLQNL